VKIRPQSTGSNGSGSSEKTIKTPKAPEQNEDREPKPFSMADAPKLMTILEDEIYPFPSPPTTEGRPVF
jgi:hypothetical protein